jgi:tRNA-dihydrouridine synthase B
MKIGNITFDRTPVCLAPMAGTSSVTFRGICVEQGASYAPTELVSARSLLYSGLERSYRYMEIDPKHEGITCIQLFGYEAKDFSEGIRIMLSDELLNKVDIIDINMGCPVSKVVRTGAGSALMKTPDVAEAIVKEAVRAASEFGKPVTVKTRIGFDEFISDQSSDFIRRLSQAGAQMICVHGRTARQMYGGTADWDALAVMCEAAHEQGIPFFANGDIKDENSATRILEHTGADGIMVGRAAMGDPWIFSRIRAKLDGAAIPSKPSNDQKCDMLMRELRGTAAHIGETTAVKEMRSVMPHYIKGLPGAAKIKVKLVGATTIDEVEEILKECRELWT